MVLLFIFYQKIIPLILYVFWKMCLKVCNVLVLKSSVFISRLQIIEYMAFSLLWSLMSTQILYILRQVTLFLVSLNVNWTDLDRFGIPRVSRYEMKF